MSGWFRAVTGAALVLALAACGGAATPAATNPAEPVTLMVLAAASLTDAFTDLAAQYEAEHEGVTIELSFGSSTTLAQQIAEGVEADLYASAGTGALDHLPEDYAADGGESLIATNALEIAVAPGNPLGITGLQDFTRTDIDTVLCAGTVPCGRAADEAFAGQSITPQPVSREIDVRATLGKVILGEADAAIVYRSDVFTEPGVDGVPIPGDQNISLDYPLVWFNSETHTVGFADFVAGPTGQEALTNAGFTVP